MSLIPGKDWLAALTDKPKSGYASVALKETFVLALDTLRVHKLRSFLTLLGVILAVTTLVLVISLVEGMNVYVAEKIANMGANVFGVDRFGIITSFEEFLKARKRPPLHHDDLKFLQENMTQAKDVAGVQYSGADIRYGNDALTGVSVQGITANYPPMRNITVEYGRALNDTDDVHRSPVVFIGADIKEKFFPTSDPLGKEIRVGKQPYMIVGVAKAQGSVFGQSQDNFVLIPMGTYEKSFQAPEYSVRMFIMAWSPEVVPAAQDEAKVLLRAKRHVRYSDPDNFGIVTSSTFTSLWEQLTGNIARMAVGLTIVFLVVGGVVIMNIMLASVTERTREIGIRKSLGARKRHIIMQFLMESSMLSAIGGLMGISTALSLAALINSALSLPMATPMSVLFLALGLSTACGLFFGVYPAVRAARLDPIVALRSEA